MTRFDDDYDDDHDGVGNTAQHAASPGLERCIRAVAYISSTMTAYLKHLYIISLENIYNLLSTRYLLQRYLYIYYIISTVKRRLN